MTCVGTCKGGCILAYYVAGVAAIILAIRAFYPQKFVNIRKEIAIFIAIAGVVSIACGLKWAFQKAKGSSSSNYL